MVLSSRSFTWRRRWANRRDAVRASLRIAVLGRLGGLVKVLLTWSAHYEFREMVRQGVVRVGPHTYGAPTILRYGPDDAKVIIGAFCSIARGVSFSLGGNHPLDHVTTFPIGSRMLGLPVDSHGHCFSRGDIIVEDDVWLATNVLVLSGVRIGRGSVVGAGAVVASDIPEYSIATGCPARVVRSRLSAEDRERVSASRWWEWPESEIAARVDELCGPAKAFPG